MLVSLASAIVGFGKDPGLPARGAGESERLTLPADAGEAGTAVAVIIEKAVAAVAAKPDSAANDHFALAVWRIIAMWGVI